MIEIGIDTKNKERHKDLIECEAPEAKGRPAYLVICREGK
jgi:hypothetical protein